MKLNTQTRNRYRSETKSIEQFYGFTVNGNTLKVISGLFTTV